MKSQVSFLHLNPISNFAFLSWIEFAFLWFRFLYQFGNHFK